MVVNSPEKQTSTPEILKTKTPEQIKQEAISWIDKLDSSRLATISSRDFLKSDRNGRLASITQESIDGRNLNQVGSSMTFNFDFNGAKNTELYLNTTAGQVLPPTVASVTLNGQEFIRDGLYGEFYARGGIRLIIDTGTSIIVSKVLTPEEIAAQEKAITETADKMGEYSKLALEAGRRNIDPDFAIIAFGDAWKNANEWEKDILLEQMLTDFGRVRWSHVLEETKWANGLYKTDFALALMVKYNADWEKKWELYWISTENIKKFKDDGGANMMLSEDLIDNGENLKWEALWNHPPFQEKVQRICTDLDINVADLKRIMEKESRINPKAVNQLTGKATGLIQFMPATAEGLGTTTGKLRGMSGVDQLDYVKRYYAQYAHKWLHTLGDLYLATFYPKAIGKPNDYIIWSEWGNPAQITMENPMPKTWQYLTKQDVINFVS